MSFFKTSRILLMATLAGLHANAAAADLGKLLNPQDDTVGPGCVAYLVRVTTGDAVGAGTDGNVFVNIKGDSAETGEIELVNQSGTPAPEGNECQVNKSFEPNSKPAGNNHFENSDAEDFIVYAEAVGNITGADVRLEGNGSAGAAWYLERLDIAPNFEIGGSAKSFKLGYGNWINTGDTARLDVNAKADLTVVVTTGTETGAGTDSNITLTIEGRTDVGPADQTSATHTILINPLISGNAFENGSVDTFTIKNAPDFWAITKVTATSDDSYAGSAWYLASITIQSPRLRGNVAQSDSKGRPAYFLFNAWLDGDHPSAAAIQTISPADQAVLDAEGVDEARSDAELEALLAKYLASLESQGPRTPPDLPPPPPDVEAEPQPEQPQDALPGDSGPSEQARCMTMVDGRVAYDQAGHNAWQPENIAALCAGATDAEARIACFERGIADHNDWNRAITECVGGGDGDNYQPPSPAEPEPEAMPPEAEVPGTEACDVAEEELCKSLLQDQVPWTTSNPGDPANRHWEQNNLDKLCHCTSGAADTVRCFQEALYNNGNEVEWPQAIDACAVP